MTWWYRTIEIPSASSSRKTLLRFEAARQRTEVYVNRKLVGYDLVGSTPFEADITDAVEPGQTAELAVRITDAGGNFDFPVFKKRDYTKCP